MPRKLPEPQEPTKDLVVIELVRSQYNPKYEALCIDDMRFGVDAGPWTVIKRFHVKRRDLIAHLKQGLKERK